MMVDLVPGSLDPLHAVRVARAAERLGLDGLWVADTDHDPFPALALAAAATERIELGTAVAIAFARSPVVLAQTAFDLARLSGGRFRLGLGTQVRGRFRLGLGTPFTVAADGSVVDEAWWRAALATLRRAAARA